MSEQNCTTKRKPLALRHINLADVPQIVAQINQANRARQAALPEYPRCEMRDWIAGAVYRCQLDAGHSGRCKYSHAEATK